MELYWRTVDQPH
ncbi:unnamed protein product [Timema podura]|uniref:Uncharacterized protein n=1 Tax=Timema podura TaxID=61482 RepID=A0ABN7PGB1_TIMPD|nr:unnamed protein product [Timema podura]